MLGQPNRFLTHVASAPKGFVVTKLYLQTLVVTQAVVTLAFWYLQS